MIIINKNCPEHFRLTNSVAVKVWIYTFELSEQWATDHVFEKWVRMRCDFSVNAFVLISASWSENGRNNPNFRIFSRILTKRALIVRRRFIADTQAMPYSRHPTHDKSLGIIKRNSPLTFMLILILILWANAFDSIHLAWNERANIIYHRRSHINGKTWDSSAKGLCCPRSIKTCTTWHI